MPKISSVHLFVLFTHWAVPGSILCHRPCRLVFCVTMSSRGRNLAPKAGSKTNASSSGHNNSTDSIDMKKISEKDLPEGVYNLLLQIHENTQQTNNTVNQLNERFNAQDENITSLKAQIQDMNSKMDILAGRLVRAEQANKRLSGEIEQMKAHSMNNNLIISSSKCKELRDENTKEVAREFLKKEMKINGVDKIGITVAHRIGPKMKDKPRSIIIKVPDADDITLIMKNVSHLKGTGSFIERQLPASMQERKKVVMPMYKAAKQKGQKPIIKQDKLFVQGSIQRQCLPINLPDNTRPSEATLNIEEGTPVDEGGSIFQGYCSEVVDLNDVRDVLNELLRNPRISSATHVIYAYRCDAGEDYDSDGDWGIGFGLLKHMVDQNIENKIFVVTRQCGPNFVHIGYKRIANAIQVCDEAYDKLNS